MSLHAYAVERDGCVTSNAHLSPRVLALLERMSRITYVIDMHRQAIAMQSTRLAELQAELEAIEGGR